MSLLLALRQRKRTAQRLGWVAQEQSGSRAGRGLVVMPYVGSGSRNQPAAAGVRCALERGGWQDSANELIEKAMTGPASRPED
jgi:hypothetical protein